MSIVELTRGYLTKKTFTNTEQKVEENQKSSTTFNSIFKDIVTKTKEELKADVDRNNDFSSDTLKTLSELSKGGGTLFAKTKEVLKNLGSYTASRALSDTELLVRLGIVAAAELVTKVPLMLPDIPSTILRNEGGNESNFNISSLSVLPCPVKT